MSGKAQIIVGDCREVLASMDAESVDCCVTSPPYWGLRDYGVDGQIGLEASVDAWVKELVAVFEQVRRVLKPSGTLWLNVGDSYAGGRRGGNPEPSTSTLQGLNATQEASKVKRSMMTVSRRRDDEPIPRSDLAVDGCKAKDLIGQPWLVAFALRAAGWYLRADIIWAKPNPMPESVRDRPTKSHEYIFLMSKGPRYYYDAAAVAEPLTESSVDRLAQDVENQAGSLRAHAGGKTNGAMKAVGTPRNDGGKWNENNGRGFYRRERADEYDKHAPPGQNPHGGLHRCSENTPGFRNARSVWTIPTQGYSGAHFATFPRELAARCIKAGCPAGGLVLDPFAGTGTTVAEAVLLGRRGIGIELNPKYAALAEERIHDHAGLLAKG